MMKFTDRQRAYHQQVLREVHVMITPAPAKIRMNTNDHDWATRKIDALLANCKG